MKTKLLMFAILFAGITTAYCQDNGNKECSGGWAKYENSPVLGGNLGTIFDISVLKDDKGVYRMYCSWRDKRSIALSESKDGLKWSDPVICLSYDDNSSWEKDLNRPVVIQKDGIYHMWYTGQADGHSWIGYAVSKDGKTWTRKSAKPVLSPELPWEKVAVMCPHVIWDEQEKIFKMWYSGGEQYEPDAIGYATSNDGLNWTKHKSNPVFANNTQNEWEQHKVTACQVIKRKSDYLMFYIGFKNIDYAQIGMARSKDGISNWERFTNNPIIRPGAGWDASAVYKPYAIPEKNYWLLYYNGRREGHEQIGIAIHKGLELGF
jgi:beta-1,2-mannobiose phosphorylase / 1,2-beta-oligomannan phosphorylase